MIKSLLISIFLLTTIGVLGQKYSFITYSTEQGLPHSQVTSITQDEKGYLWVGTLGGLSKFNGSTFKTFSSNDGLLNNKVTSLSIIDFTLWVGHDGGVSYVKNNKVKKIEFSKTQNDRARSVSKIIQFKNQIFICSNGGGLYRKKNEHLEKVELADSDFERIRSAVVYNKTLYLATRGGVLTSVDGENFKRIEELGNKSFSGLFVKGNQMVFTTFREGVFIKNLVSKSIQEIEPDLLKYSVYGCYIDQLDDIWLTSLNGMINIHQGDEISFIDEPRGLPLNLLSCYFNDSEGNFWIGSQGKGLFRYPGENFKYFDKTTGFPSDLFLTGFQNVNKDYYFGTLDKGIVSKNKNGKIKIIDSQEQTIWGSIKGVNGSSWFGTETSLVEQKANGRIRTYYFEEEPNLPGAKITSFLKIAPTKMYIGGNGGVSIYEEGRFRKLTNEKGADVGTVRDMEMLNGKLFCVSNLGLFQYQNKSFENVNHFDQAIFNIEKDENGVVWFGGEEGLYKLIDGRIKQLKLLDDPASNYINFLNYRKGQLFVGTNNGLFIISDLDKEQPKIKRFGIENGVLDLETNLNSGFFDAEESFWFGTASGLVCYHLENEIIVKSPPKINLTSILVNYEKFDYSKYSDALNEYGFPLSLELPFKKNSLTFEMDGISLANYKGISFQFWLEGLRETWSSPSSNTTVSFSSLPAGEYTLHLRSVDMEGGSSNEIRMPFIINVAFYNSWWFYLLIALLITGVAYAIFRNRIKRIAASNEQDKLRYKSRLLILEQQSMNASMNRHFIFNSLNSIQYFINTQDKFSANKYLTSFAKLIRKNLDSATSPGNIISLEDELERIKLYLSLESMRFKDRFDYEFVITDVDVESEFIPAMIMQPFIENSIMHGILPNENKKGHIKVDIRSVDDYIEILIVDNGIGIVRSMSQKKQMAGDHKSQGMEITSKRIKLIQKISENNISLVGPNEIVDSNGSINGTRVLIKIPRENLVD